MKKLMLAAAVLAAVLSVYPARAGSAVEPVSVTITNTRSDAASSVSAGTIYRSSSLTFTNCALYQATTGTVQTLTNVTVQVSVGDLSTNTDYTASVSDAALGKWSCKITVPNMSSWLMQVKITDENTNSYIYPSRTFTSETSMF